MAPVSAGDFSSAERGAVDDAIRRGEQLCRFELSVYVGRSEEDPRTFATSLHNSLRSPERSILIMLDPDGKALEIVTGSKVRERLSDQEVELAAVSMRSEFAAGNLAGGLCQGIAMLAEHARPRRTLHGTADHAAGGHAG